MIFIFTKLRQQDVTSLLTKALFTYVYEHITQPQSNSVIRYNKHIECMFCGVSPSIHYNVEAFGLFVKHF